MPHPLTIRSHLPPEDIRRRYLACHHLIERSHWQALWLLVRPDDSLTAAQAARVLGCTATWVRALARRYNAEGPTGLEDRRKRNGGKPILHERQQKALVSVLQESPADGGLWSGPKVAQWMEKILARRVSAVTGWQYLRRLGFTLHVPRPHHAEGASKEEQRRWRKNFAENPSFAV